MYTIKITYEQPKWIQSLTYLALRLVLFAQTLKALKPNLLKTLFY